MGVEGELGGEHCTMLYTYMGMRIMSIWEGLHDAWSHVCDQVHNEERDKYSYDIGCAMITSFNEIC